MKAEELMVGDYLTFLDVQNDSNCPKLRVIVINEEDVYVSNDGDPVADLCDPKELSGIPLTPEILEKNGFKRRASFGYEWKEHIGGYMGQTTSSTTPIEIIYYDEGHCVVSNPHIGRVFQGSIDSVHELQHALRLCGINKEITI